MLWLVGATLILVSLLAWTALISRGIARMVPAEGKLLEAGPVCFHYLDLGPPDAPAIVMVHGILSNTRIFTYHLAPAMARDHRVIVVDRPGWGYSALNGERLHIGKQADAIAHLIGQLNLQKPLIVGHSMGGALALALALAHPDKARGLALIAPLTQVLDRPPAAFASYHLPPILAQLISVSIAIPIAMLTGKTKTAKVFAPDPVPADFAVRGGGALAIQPESFRQAAFEIGSTREALQAQVGRYAEIKLPVAILYGKADAILDPQSHGMITASAIAGATIEQVEGGHMLPITAPDITEAWLRRVSASSRPTAASSSPDPVS